MMRSRQAFPADSDLVSGDEFPAQRWQIIVAVALVGLGVFVVIGQRIGPWASDCLPNAALHLADSAAKAAQIVSAGNSSCSEENTAEAELEALYASWFYTIGSTLLMLGTFWLGSLRLFGVNRRSLCLGAMLATGLLFVVDVIENLATWRGLSEPLAATWADRAFWLGAHAAVLKYALTLPLLASTAAVLGTLIGRGFLGLLGRTSTVNRPKDFASDEAVLIAPSRLKRNPSKNPETLTITSVRYTHGNEKDPLVGGDAHRWVDAAPRLPRRPAARLSISASGGGIRSAILNLGALQEFRRRRISSLGDKSILESADYLVSVSGGGYTVGAFQLALQPPRSDPASPNVQPQDAPTLRAPATVFAPGSVEEDHVRRHANYVADSAREWLVALAVLLRGVIVSLGLLTLVVIFIGMGTNLFYRFVPVFCTSAARPQYYAVTSGQGWDCPDVPWFGQPSAAGDGYSPSLPQLIGPAQHVVLLLLALAGLVWLAHLAAKGFPDAQLGRRIYEFTRAAGWSLVLLLLVTTGYVWVTPTLLWASSWLTYAVPAVPNPTSADAGVAATVVTFITWLGALATTLWRTVERVKPTGESLSRFRKGTQAVESAVGTSLLQRAIVGTVLFIIGLFYLQVFAAVTTTSGNLGGAFRWVFAGLGLLLMILWIVVDQTWVSLHPFYRRRLASAFAVRRVLDDDQVVRAQRYPDTEMTRLSEYANPPEPSSNGGGTDFPRVIFAACAAVSGHYAPPGRRVVSWTFAGDYVGGPDVGYVETSVFQETASRVIRQDLTVQAAMAISGAAVASSMGRMSSPSQRLLALANMRLGTWLPHPSYLVKLADASPECRVWMPRLPHVRRLNSYLREVFGAFGGDERMLLCTDGGHYENLGLVENLRIGSQLIFVVDGTADKPPFASTLGDAIALAREELGVEIVFKPDDLSALVPGSAEPLTPASLAALANRMSKKCVAVGTIRYPQELHTRQGVPFSTGTIVFAKATITPDMPYDLLTYALQEPTFPRMNTADQWFNHRQFDAYHALGKFLAQAAAEEYSFGTRPKVGQLPI